MIQPKYSVILPNYLLPQDRFTTYGESRKSAAELIAVCSSQGVFHGIEMIAGDAEPCLGRHNLREVKAALDNSGLKLAGVAAHTWSAEFKKGSLSSSNPRIRGIALDSVKRAMDLAAEAGCSFVNQWPGQDGWDFYFEVDYQKAYSWWVEGMQTLADYNPEIRLGIEPKPYEPRAFSFIDTSVKVLLLIKDIQRKNVGLTLDIGHSLYGHENIAQAVALAQMDRRLFHLHMNDNYGDMDWDMPFGAVHLQGLIELMYWLVRTDYQGYMSVDIFAYRNDPAETILEGQRWMQAIVNLIARMGLEAFDQLVTAGDGLATQRYLREIIFER